MSTTPAFPDVVQASLDLRWNLDPVAATSAGITRYDDRLGAYRADDVQQYVAALKAEANALEAVDVATLDDEIDRTALLNDTRVTVHRFEREKPHERDPAFWLSHALEGLYHLLALRDRPREHRAAAAASRLRAVPDFLAAAQATLADCPHVFVDSALHVARGGVSLIDEVETHLVPPNDETFPQTCADARDALAGFAQFLRRDVLARPDTPFAIGEDAFNFRLHYEHALRNTASELWRYGNKLVQEVEADLSRLAARLDGGKRWPDVVERLRADHPSAEGLVAAYADAMARARDFVAERGLTPIPDARLEVIATPSFLRPLMPFAAYQSPGAFSDDRTGWFYVTPPDDGTPPEAMEAMLRDHSVHDIPSTALHEGYPGHHLHLAFAVTQPRAVRKVVFSPLSVEGWALYCEDMMGEEGFYTSIEEQVFQKLALLWRAVRIVIDVGLHTGGMTFDEGVELLLRRLHFDRSHAEAEVRRYCAHPVYQLCYAVGRRDLKQLRDDYRRAAGGDFSLRKFHEAVLVYGGLPVSLMRWGMGLDDR